MPVSGLLIHVLNHLPSVDFRAYKTGVSIPDGMSIPEDAPKPKYDYHWKFIVDGNEKIITTGGDYPVVDGEFISVETVELEKGYEPPIHDFSIEMEGEDFTEDLMKEKNYLWLFLMIYLRPLTKVLKTLSQSQTKQLVKVIL